MSFASLLRHSVEIRRQFAVVDLAGDPTYDERGAPITAPQTVAVWRCLIQPKSARERAALSQAGPVVADHTIFGFPVDLSPADALRPGDGRVFEVLSIDDAGGQDHHFEVQARLISSDDVPES